MIDLIYVFRFNGKKLIEALERLKLSLTSLNGQPVHIIILNQSVKDIKNELKQFKIDYYHVPLNVNEPLCKSKMLNLAIKNFVKTPYFFLSDVDMIYPKNYIESMLMIALKAKETYRKEVRIIPGVYMLQEMNWSSDYDKLMEKYKGWYPTELAHGNGLVCRKTFDSIKGFDERFVGWGHEDQMFNDAVSQTDMCVFAIGIKTLHLMHSYSKTRKKTGLQNESIWFKESKRVETNWCNYGEV